MAYLLFVDESGQDQRESPYEVLAGIAVADRDLWDLIREIQDAEKRFFGRRVSNDHDGDLELKGKKLLKAKTFKHAKQAGPMDAEERTEQARACIDEGAAAKAAKQSAVVTRRMLTAIGQAKLAFVDHVLNLLAEHKVRAFASIVEARCPRPTAAKFLRKDYAYLFERYFGFLDKKAGRPQGLVVFDELERVQSRILIDQMRSYFLETVTGRMRSSLVVPEPFFRALRFDYAHPGRRHRRVRHRLGGNHPPHESRAPR